MKHKSLGRAIRQRFSCILQIVLVVLALTTPALAKESFPYVYDETGQLIKAIDSTGTVIEYVYDVRWNSLSVQIFCSH